MPTILTHALVGAALVPIFCTRPVAKRVWASAIVLPMLPDLDVIGLQFGVAYGDAWGHRGISHSLCAALVTGSIATLALLHGDLRSYRSWKMALLFWLCVASHGLLDALTNGGKGVAFFAPWNDTRYFLPWRPIAVSPIGIRNFLSASGLRVLFSELLWVWLPAGLLSYLAIRLGQRAVSRSS